MSALFGAIEVCDGVTCLDVDCDLVEADATELRLQTGEVLVRQLLREADDLEQLSTGVRRERRDAHLGHHLQDTLAGCLDVVRDALLEGQTLELAVLQELVDGLESHVRVDRCGTEADEERHVVHLAGVAGLDDEADLGARLLTNQVVVHGRGEEQRRDRRVVLGGLTVREHDDACATLDCLRDLVLDALERTTDTVAAFLDGGVQAADHDAAEAREFAVVVDVNELRQVVVVQDRLRERNLLAGVRIRVQQVTLGADGRAEAGDNLFTDRVERRVGDLSEELREVVEQHPGT